MLKNMKKVIVFGSGAVGIKVKRKLQAEGYEIVAFTDNDAKKWGNFIEDTIIIEPKRIAETEVDIIAIGLYKAAYVIKEQLLSYGIPEHKIIIPIEPSRIFLNPDTGENEKINELDESDYTSQVTNWYDSLQINIKDEEFLKKLESLKDVLTVNRIPRSKVCIVSGAVLQVLGLRESKLFDDIDIIMTSDLREIYGAGLVIVSESAEMHPQNEYEVLDDDIIQDVNLHFVFRDIKFMHPKILYSYGKIKKIDEYEKIGDLLRRK